MRMIPSQVVSIARYEFRMLWRERAQVVITLVLLLMVLIPSLIATNDVNGINGDDSFAFQGKIVPMTQIIVMVLWGPVGISMAVLSPIFLADLIPKDRQLRVRELFDATALPRWAYLAGKLLGGWLAMFSTLLVVMLAAGAVWWLRIGPIDLRLYLDMWLIGAVSLVIINGGLGILLPATQTTRRRAILLMIGLVVVGALFSNQYSQEQVFSPLRAPVILYYMDPSTTAMRGNYFATIVIGLLQLIIVALCVWGWMRWRETQR